MITALVLSAICVCVKGSGPLHTELAPVVTAASSQYFQRTFNRLVVAPVLETPVLVAEPLPAVVPKTAVVPVSAARPTTPARPVQPLDPNIAIAVATAHAPPPVNTFIFPRFPVVPSTASDSPRRPSNVSPKDKPREEVTPRTPRVTTIGTTEATTTSQPEFNLAAGASSSTDDDFLPLPPAFSASNNDGFSVPSSSNQNNNFDGYAPPVRRPLPTNNIINMEPYPLKNAVPPRPAFSNQNNNFNRYGAPSTQKLQQSTINFAIGPNSLIRNYHRPQKLQTPFAHSQKLRTSVEIVRAPLVYIAPPPIHHHIKHIHTFVPSKVIVTPVRFTTFKGAPARIRSQVQTRNFNVSHTQITLRDPLIPRDIEPTTFSPFPKTNTRPPKI